MTTFIVDWPALAFLGFLFGAFSPQTRWWRSRAFLAGLAAAVAFTVVAISSYAIAPAWMWMYFFEPSEVAWAVPVIVLAYLFAFVAAFASAVALAALGRGYVWASAAFAVVVELVVVALTWDRYHLVGTRAEWISGEASELVTLTPSDEARAIGLLAPIFLLTFAVGLVVAYRSGRETAVDR